jgi:DNA-binding HxlR family transcriptional regulator
MGKDNLKAAPRKPAKVSGDLPVAGMVEDIVGCKWSMRLLGLVAAGRSRPSVLLRECEGMSAKVMNERMNKMMRFGIVQRVVIGEKPPLEVQYTLTPFGNRFNDLIEQVRRLQAEFDQ